MRQLCSLHWYSHTLQTFFYCPSTFPSGYHLSLTVLPPLPLPMYAQGTVSRLNDTPELSLRQGGISFESWTCLQTSASSPSLARDIHRWSRLFGIATVKPHQHPASATLLHSPTLPHKHTSFCHTLALTNTSSQAHQHQLYSCHTSICHSCTHQHFFTTRAAGAHQPHQSHQLKHFHTTKSC